MNSRLRRWMTALVLVTLQATLVPGEPVSGYWHRRFDSPGFTVRSIEGLDEHIVDGKLHLNLHLFLQLLLRNSPDVQLSQLDVNTAQSQITAARAPFDPAFGLGFSAQRSVSPLLFASAGSGG